MDTLVLNSAYMPVNRVNWRRAIQYVINGRAEVLEEYEDRFIHSDSTALQMPSVIRFLRRVARHVWQGVKFNRKNVWLRDGGKCRYCNCEVSLRKFTFDHVIPKSKGGTGVWTNIVVACLKCNQKKRNRTPKEAGMTLVGPVERPKSIPTVDVLALWGDDIPETWLDYLRSYKYWEGELR